MILRILILDDIKADAELIIHELQKSDYQLIHQHVSNKDEFVKALHNFAPDIILSDYSLPMFSGMEALKITMQYNSSIPFILVSGTLSEELAVNCIKKGAWDYVLKENLIRLIPVIDNALKLRAEKIEREKANKALIESEKKYRNIVELAPDAIFTLDLNGIITSCNNSFLKFSGYDRKEIENQHFTELIVFSENDKELLRKYFDKFLCNEKKIETIIVPWVPKNGKVRYTEILASLTKENDIPESFHVVARDISERKKAEEALKQTEINYQKLQENVPVGIYRSIPGEKFVSVNLAMVKIFGFDSAAGLYKVNIHDLFVDSGAKEDFLKIVRQKGQVSDYELLLKKKDGSHFWASMSSRQIEKEDKKGNLQVYLDGVLRDITEQKEIEDALKLTQFSVENSSDSIFWLNKEGKFLYVNAAACKFLGYSRDELLNMHVFDICPTHPLEKWLDRWEELKKKGHMVIETINRTRGGKDIPVETTMNFLDFKGNEINFAYSRDITERKEAEKRLKDAKEMAEESDKLKTAFLANMSHEIRTPMNAIVGFSELLIKERLPLDQKFEFKSIIKNSCSTLSRLIEDIIDASKIQVGQLNFEEYKFSVSKMITELHANYKNEIKKSGKSIELRIVKPKEEVHVFSDGIRIRQVLTNLIENAFKFTRDGYIEFGFEIEAEMLRFFVKDTGMGIPKEKVDSIFNRFFQLDNSHTRQVGGAGLGLYITRNIIQLLGGEIQVESEYGSGTTFYFTLPLLPVKSDKKDAGSVEEGIDYSKYRWDNKVMLIAEDTYSNFQFLKALFKHTNIQIEWAKTGMEVVEMYQSLSNVDIILMDIQLPEMSGFDAIRMIKDINNRVPIIAQTAYAMTGDKEKALQFGCNAYLSKPLDINKLFGLINDYLLQKN